MPVFLSLPTEALVNGSVQHAVDMAGLGKGLQAEKGVNLLALAILTLFDFTHAPMRTMLPM